MSGIHFRAGLAFRLQVALGLLMLLMTVLAMVTVGSFEDVRNQFEDVANRRLAMALDINRLAQESEGIIAQAPQLVLSDAIAPMNTLQAQISDQVRWLEHLASLLVSYGVPADRMAVLDQRKVTLVSRLIALQEAVRSRILSKATINSTLAELADMEQSITAFSQAESLSPSGQRMLLALQRSAFLASGILAAGDRGAMARLRISLTTSDADLDRVWNTLTPAEKTRLSYLLATVRTATNTETGVVVQKLDYFQREDAVKAALRLSKIAANAMTETTSSLITEIEADVDRRRQEVSDRLTFNKQLLIVGGALTLGWALLVFWFVQRSVVHRLRRVQHAVLGRVRGEEHDIPVDGSDEIADIGRAVAYFVSAIHSRERAVRMSEKQLRDLVEAAPFPLLMVEGNGHEVLMANGDARSSLRLLDSGEAVNAGPGEGSSTSLIDLVVSDEDRRRLLNLLRMNCAVRGVEIQLQYASGRAFWALLSLTPVVFEFRDCLLVTIYDVDRLKTAEARLVELVGDLKRSNDDLEQFAYIASHDLREPLRMVASYLSLIERRFGATLTEEAKEFLGFAIAGAKRMDRLVLDLLAFSRVGRGELAGRVPMADVIAQALANLHVVITDAKAVIDVKGTMPPVRGNIGDLIRLIQNLVSNALRYRSPDRPPRITISCTAIERMWRFAISDNGIGIDPEFYERIFLIFQRLRPQSPNDEGTGIGLAVCRKVVERHGGHIWLESEPGEGTTFYFTLPVESQNERRRLSASTSDPAEQV